MSSGAQLKFERWMQFVYVQFIKHVLRTVNYIGPTAILPLEFFFFKQRDAFSGLTKTFSCLGDFYCDQKDIGLMASYMLFASVPQVW